MVLKLGSAQSRGTLPTIYCYIATEVLDISAITNRDLTHYIIRWDFKYLPRTSKMWGTVRGRNGTEEVSVDLLGGIN